MGWLLCCWRTCDVERERCLAVVITYRVLVSASLRYHKAAPVSRRCLLDRTVDAGGRGYSADMAALVIEMVPSSQRGALCDASVPVVCEGR